jgi:hypothetical protein
MLWLCFILLVLSLAELVIFGVAILLAFAHQWLGLGACVFVLVAIGFVESQMVREFWDVEDAT